MLQPFWVPTARRRQGDLVIIIDIILIHPQTQPHAAKGLRALRRSVDVAIAGLSTEACHEASMACDQHGINIWHPGSWGISVKPEGHLRRWAC